MLRLYTNMTVFYRPARRGPRQAMTCKRRENAFINKRRCFYNVLLMSTERQGHSVVGEDERSTDDEDHCHYHEVGHVS